MGDDITLEDPGGLHAFAKAVRDIADYLKSHHQTSQPLTALPHFGQQASLTQVPKQLADNFQKSMDEIGGNLQHLLDKLYWIADAADKIANRYTTTQDLDKLSVAEIEADLGITPAG